MFLQILRVDIRLEKEIPERPLADAGNAQGA